MIDEATLTACYERLQLPLHNVLFRWLWNAQECQDVMHDGYLRVWAQRRKVGAETLEPMIWATCLNLAKNRLRWRRLWRWVGEEQLEPTEPVRSVDGDVVQHVEHAQLRRALEQLPDSARQILLLSEFAGLSTDELAQVLKIAPGTVASRKHRAIERLRALLSDQGSAPPTRERWDG